MFQSDSYAFLFIDRRLYDYEAVLVLSYTECFFTIRMLALPMFLPYVLRSSMNITPANFNISQINIKEDFLELSLCRP